MSKATPKEDFLEYLFESPAKIRLLRLFLRNPEEKLQVRQITQRLKLRTDEASKEINRLRGLGFLRMRMTRTPGGASRKIFFINPEFPLVDDLRGLLLKSLPSFHDRITKEVRRLGRIRLAVLAGIFANEEISKADLLIVGDGIKNRRLKGFIGNLEAEMGKEINCVAMNTKEFLYRYNMYDRFVRDFLNPKYKRLVDSLKI